MRRERSRQLRLQDIIAGSFVYSMPGKPGIAENKDLVPVLVPIYQFTDKSF